MRVILKVLLVLSFFVSIPPTTTEAASSCGGQVSGRDITPPGWEDRPVFLERANSPYAPLILMLHGKNGCIEGFQVRSALAESGRVSVLWVSGEKIAPGSTSRVWDAWNGAKGKRTRDYLTSAIAAAHSVGLNPAVTIAAGVSMGGFTSMWLGCFMPELFDGAVPVAGVTNAQCPHSDTSLMMVVGARDGSIKGATAANVGAEMWVSRAATCPNPPVKTDIGTVHHVYYRCLNNVTVETYVVDTAGHEWIKRWEFDTDKEIVRFAYSIIPRYDYRSWTMKLL